MTRTSNLSASTFCIIYEFGMIPEEKFLPEITKNTILLSFILGFGSENYFESA